MIYKDAQSWFTGMFHDWFDLFGLTALKLLLGEVDSAVLCPILRTHQISPISRVNKLNMVS